MGVGEKEGLLNIAVLEDTTIAASVSDRSSTELTAHDFLTHDIFLLSFGNFQFIEVVKNTSGSVSPCVQRWAGTHDRRYDITPNGTVKSPPSSSRPSGERPSVETNSKTLPP